MSQMTPLQRACFVFPDRNAIARRIGNLAVYLSVKATAARDAGSWIAIVERVDGAPVASWSPDDKALAANHLRRLVRGVGAEPNRYTRGESFIGLERSLSAKELSKMAPPMPEALVAEHQVEAAESPEFSAWRRAVLWIAWFLARRALPKRQAPALPPAPEPPAEERSDA